MKEIQQIIEGYKSGKSIYDLAKEYDYHFQTIWRNLKKNDIKLRKTWEHITLKMPNTFLTELQKQIVEGCLLGDGSVFSKATAYFSLECVEEKYLLMLTTLLPFRKWRWRKRIKDAVPFKGLIYACKPTYTITSTCDKSLNKFRKRWYPEGKKIVPKDLICSPTTFRHWFYGDGSTSYVKYKGKKLGTQLTFCTHCFNKNDCDFLANKLWESCETKVGVYFDDGKPFLKTTNIQSVRNFFNYIDKCETECYEYKWKIPKYCQPYRISVL